MKLFSFKKCGNSRADFRIVIDGETFERKIESAYLKQKKYICVPGFRKGKAPRKVIENHFGSDVFFKNVIDDMFMDIISFVSESTGEKILSKGAVFMIENFDSKPTIVNVDKADVAINGNVQLDGGLHVNYKGLKLTKTLRKVDQKDADNVIKQYAESCAVLTDMGSDYKAKNGDIVNISFETKIMDKDGNLKDEKISGFENVENFEYKIGSNDFAKEFDEGIKDHSVSDGEFSFIVKIPENHDLKKYKECTMLVKLKINNVRKCEYLDIKDLAAKFGHSSTDSFRSHAMKLAQKKEDMISRKNLESQIMNELINRDGVNEDEVLAKVSKVKQEIIRELESYGITLEQYLNFIGVNEMEFNKQIADDVLEKTAVDNLINHIAKLEGLAVSDDELNNSYRIIALNESGKNSEENIEAAKKKYPENNVMREILHRKVMDKVLEYADINTVESA
ncbi:MAG: FKBP-type peptidyl-prolyl cis-trans isomerase [Firmicutes bacterium]|nr:FKBP-type peptidyl-prolyl cis-trans isomerase [Bacillota bacterium]